MSTTTNDFNTQSTAVPAPIAKVVDQKDLVTGVDSRGQSAGSNTSALKGNDTAPRAETTDQENAGA